MVTLRNKDKPSDLVLTEINGKKYVSVEELLYSLRFLRTKLKQEQIRSEHQEYYRGLITSVQIWIDLFTRTITPSVKRGGVAK